MLQSYYMVSSKSMIWLQNMEWYLNILMSTPATEGVVLIFLLRLYVICKTTLTWIYKWLWYRLYGLILTQIDQLILYSIFMYDIWITISLMFYPWITPINFKNWYWLLCWFWFCSILRIYGPTWIIIHK